MRLQAKSGGRGILGQERTSHTLSLKVSHADKDTPQRGLEVYWTLLEMESIQTSISRTRHSNCRICRLSRVRVDILEQTKAWTRRGTFRRASLSQCPKSVTERRDETQRRDQVNGHCISHSGEPLGTCNARYILYIFEAGAGVCIVHITSKLKDHLKEHGLRRPEPASWERDYIHAR
jgi:hypothetical protein